MYQWHYLPDTRPWRVFCSGGLFHRLDAILNRAMLKRRPCTLLIQYIGKFLEQMPVQHPTFQLLLNLYAGRVWATLFRAYMTARSGPLLYANVGVLAKGLVKRTRCGHPPANTGRKSGAAIWIQRFNSEA